MYVRVSPDNNLIKIILVTAVMAIPVSLLNTETPLKLVAVILVGMAIYGVGIVLLKPLTIDQIRSNISAPRSELSDQ